MKNGKRYLVRYVFSASWLHLLEEERPWWILWAPLALSSGIALYGALPQEPRWNIFLGIVVGGCIFCGGGLWILRKHLLYPVWTFFTWFLAWCSLGFGIMGHRAHSINPGKLSGSVTAYVRGIVASVEHPASTRRLFQRVVLKSITSPVQLPKAVRITIRTPCPPLYEGDEISCLVRVSPFSRAACPGGYDGHIHNFFLGIGASGFALSPVKVLHSAPSFFQKFRQNLTRYFHKNLSPVEASLACALITGDKASIPDFVKKEFSDSGLSHVLAISGLHVAIVSSLSFFVLQRVLACLPLCALYLPLHIFSAVGALFLGWGYLKISGGGYPVVRSFWMLVATMMALIMGRRKDSRRILALCALFLLLHTPEALFNLSFQLSFCAVAALLSVYSSRKRDMADHTRKEHLSSSLHAFFSPLLASIWSMLCTTTAVTFATIPITAFYFHNISMQSHISNMLAIPFTSLVIMPLGSIIVVLYACGITIPFLFFLWEKSLWALGYCAHWTTKNLWFLLFSFPPYKAGGFCLSMVGVFFWIIWKRSWRWWGVALWIMGWCVACLQLQRPTIFFDPEKKIIAYADYEKNILWVSSSRRGKFHIQQWMSIFGLTSMRHLSLEACGHILPLWPGANLGIVKEDRLYFFIPTALLPCDVSSKKKIGATWIVVSLDDFYQRGVTVLFVDKKRVWVQAPKTARLWEQ